MRLLLWILAMFISTMTMGQTSYHVEIPDGFISVNVYGSGDPILIINGGPGMSSSGFSAIAENLSSTHQCILFDQRGTGRSRLSEISTDTMTMDLMISDIEAIRKYFKFDNWVVLGHSFGGMLASYYLKIHPDRIKSLILSGSGGYDLSITRNLNLRARLSTVEQDSLQFWNMKIRQGDTSYYARYQRGKYLAPAYLYDETHVPTIAHRLTQSNLRINGLLWQDLRRIGFDCSHALKAFDKPVLIIQGDQDVMDKNIAINTHNLLPNSQLVFIKNCVHYGWLEQPEIYFDAINKFLNNQY